MTMIWTRNDLNQFGSQVPVVKRVGSAPTLSNRGAGTANARRHLLGAN